MTETLPLVLPAGTYQEIGGQVVMEGENGQQVAGPLYQWLTATTQSGYTGTAYLQTSLDVDQLYQTSQITSSPCVEYAVNFTTPGTYTLWLRGYANNAAGDSAYLKVGSAGQIATVTGFAPRTWSWASLTLSGVAATQPLTKTGLVTLSLWMREDGLHLDRLLLTTNTTYIPTGFGPAESARIATQTTLSTTITRTIVYTYDDLYRLTNANYSTGELFAYTYDPAGNRKSQTTLAGTNVYTYDAANRLTQVDGVTYGWDNNGNLTSDGQRTFTYDSANRLTSVVGGGLTTQFKYNGDGDRLAQIVAGITTNYALDPTGLAQVLIETTSGQSTHYLPGLAQYGGNAWSYYLPDRLGSVRQLTDHSGTVTLARSYDPFGNGLEQVGAGQSTFGYTGEQMDPTGLVFLRARYYNPAIGRFLTKDPWLGDITRPQSLNGWSYVEGNPVNYTDPSGRCRGLSGAAFDVCAAAAIGTATVLNTANEYRQDIFFPGPNTTFADRLEASFVVGAVPLYVASPFVAPATTAIPIYATFGGATGAGGNVAGQVLNNRFVGNKSWAESWQSVNWTDVKVAGGVNFMAGGLAPGVGQSFWGNIGLGAAANSSQYTISQCVNNRPFSIFDFGYNAALGGAVSWWLGPTPKLGPGSFAVPVPGGPGSSIQGAAEYELLRMQMEAINRVSIARGLTGATATNTDWVHLFDLPHPDEVQ